MSRPLTPPLRSIRQDDTHRLIPTVYSERDLMLELAENDEDIDALLELDSATNERALGEANLLPGISVHELLFGVPHARTVNAAFTHAHPVGSRFNSAERGAWYAAYDLETAEAEVAFHKSEELKEIGWHEPETFMFNDYLADFRADFHDIRDDATYADCLDPNSYSRSQELARHLLVSGSAGIVCPSVRRPRGTCLVCFRPALVTNLRADRTTKITFRNAYSAPEISH